MKKDIINEFLNNDEFKIQIDEKLDQLIQDTLHLSSFDQMGENNIFKELLSYGEKLVPYLINRINTDTCIVIYILISKIIKIDIKIENRGKLIKMKDDYNEWWENNKDNYVG